MRDVEGTEKTIHALENEGEPSSPRASKKRRLDDGSDAPPDPQPGLTGESADNQSDRDLVAALTEAVGQSDENHAGGAASTSPAVAASNTSAAPDVASMISDIMDHTERVEQHVAMGPQPMVDSNGQATTGLVCLKANSHLKLQSLPILDNLVRASSPCWLLCSLNLADFECHTVHADPVFVGKILISRHHILCLRTGL